MFLCTFEVLFRNYFKFEEKSKEEKDEEPPCRRSLGLATDRQRSRRHHRPRAL